MPQPLGNHSQTCNQNSVLAMWPLANPLSLVVLQISKLIQHPKDTPRSLSFSQWLAAPLTQPTPVPRNTQLSQPGASCLCSLQTQAL